jgi:hypothetical protein
MQFETEYQLMLFREIESQSFDENGEAYTRNASLYIMEQMLKLINQMEIEIHALEKGLLKEGELF